ncbi:MAG TPA: two-component regulator propeller domain-containing protein, partial [Bacteroidales bacterium]|nr:two-component regulator propeller domain-containing protein [Bacteroidales bacterium]
RGGGLNKYDGYDFHIYNNLENNQYSLSDNIVLAILEDSEGFIWVGTDDGKINRFNRTTGRFKSYQLEDKPDVLQSATKAVRAIYEDSKGILWIGSNKGVYNFNKKTDRFEPVMDDAPFPIKGITGIVEDSDGYFYIATWDRLIRYHPQQETYDQLTFKTNPFADFGGRITPIMLDKDNCLWIGTPEGLKMVDLRNGFNYTTDIIDKIDWPESFEYVRTMKETSDGLIWFGTKNGLYALSADKSNLRGYRTDPSDPGSLIHNSIYSLCEDEVGTLWVGTWSSLSVLDKRKYSFEHYAHQFNNQNSLSNDIVSSFQEDRNGTWVGTEQGGLNFMNAERTKFVSFKHDDNNPSSLPTNNVKSLFRDSNNDLWVGTFNGGLSLYEGNGRFSSFLNGYSVYCMTENPDGRLYIGTRIGLYVMDLETREISAEVFPSFTGMSHIEFFITTLFTDSQKRLWVGTRSDGLFMFDPMRLNIRKFNSALSDTTTISDNNIISICEDTNQNIWIGTANGLNRFNEVDYSFERVSQRIGIKDYVVNGLQSDDHDQIWISTNTGLYVYDQDNNELRHFDYLDGLQSNEFNRGASYQNSKGELFFGGVKGFNVFNPDKIRKNPDPPPVILTDLKLFNESVIPGEKNAPLDKHISEADNIVLSHHQSSFSFEFVALNYLVPEKNNYAYILEGYEENWNQAGRSRTASYMNLNPGNYTFYVKGSNNDNVWNEEGASINIKVKAPFYATPIAIFIYFIVLAFLLFALIRIVKFRTEKENELMLERAEKMRIKELNVKRLQFFTNISHEFRTPLTLIAGPLDKLISGKYDHQKDYLLQLMKSNVNRMLRQVNQLMDFRKIENDKMLLRVQKKNMEKFLSQIVLGFEDLADSKMIELRFNANVNPSADDEQWFDVGILDKVVYNLLSNAFKFTPEEGIISVNLNLDGQKARIEVSDTGIGIDQTKLEKIFERFYSESSDNVSTGIGLSLSKRLIDLHRGTIEVESEKSKGAKLTVTIPVSRDSFNDNEISGSENEFVLERPELDSLPSSLPITEAYAGSADSNQIILIVEDNPEMSSYLTNHLNSYKLLLADNGATGLKLAKENIPDIIVTDVMMPEMNGIELCKAVKKEFLTSHIPVVLLTAKAAIDEKIEGLDKAGADAYIEKPFDPEYLSVQIRNLLTQRKKLKDKYSGLIAEKSKPEEKINKDELFLQNINKIVNEHITDPYFSIDQLLEEIGMSRSQLYRKFKAISDKNPSEYIRILRLQYASELISKNNNTISEIAFMSGFGNVSYFNTCFKRHFGVSPGKYASEKK